MPRGKGKGKIKKPETSNLADLSIDQQTNSVVKEVVAHRDQSKQTTVNVKITTKRRKLNQKDEQAGNKNFVSLLLTLRKEQKCFLPVTQGKMLNWYPNRARLAELLLTSKRMTPSCKWKWGMLIMNF